MRIGIITLPLHVNFGGFLQNYALQQVLKEMVYEPITLNQRIIPKPIILQIKEIMQANIHTFVLSFIGKKRNRQYLYYHGTSIRTLLWKNSTYFYDTYINHTEPMNPNLDYNGISERLGLGALVVGSDQVWRPKYVENLSTMFLGFEHNPKIKKIAYAASFGTGKWEYCEEQTNECAKLAKQFDLITVRESVGEVFVNNFLASNAEFVLDPTLLLNKEDYIKIVEKENEVKSEGNLFCYILDMTEEKKQFIGHVEKQLGLKSFYVNIGENTRPFTKRFIKKHLERFQNPTVTKWLRGFMDAEMVIADSFHAVAFAILFNKPFWVVGNSGRGMARFESILSLFNLKNRLVDAESLIQKNVTEPIDWNSVNQIREEWKNKSLKLLQDILAK